MDIFVTFLPCSTCVRFVAGNFRCSSLFTPCFGYDVRKLANLCRTPGIASTKGGMFILRALVPLLITCNIVSLVVLSILHKYCNSNGLADIGLGANLSLALRLQDHVHGLGVPVCRGDRLVEGPIRHGRGIHDGGEPDSRFVAFFSSLYGVIHYCSSGIGL